MEQVKANALTWVRAFFAAADSLNVENLREFYTDDAVAQYGGHTSSRSRDNVLNMLKTIFGRLDQMKHEIGHTDVLTDRIYQYVHVTYKLKGDTQIKKLPGLVVLHKTPAERKMRRFEVFVDSSLFL